MLFHLKNKVFGGAHKQVHWSRADLVIRFCASSTAPAGYIIPQKWFARLNDFDLWFVSEGNITMTHRDGEKTNLTWGNVILLAPGDLFELKVASEGGYANCYVHFDFVNKNGKIIPHHLIQMPPTFSFTHDAHYFESTMRRIMLLQYQSQKASVPIKQAIAAQTACMLRTLLYDCEFGHMIRETRVTGTNMHYEEIVTSAIAWLYLNPTVSVIELAQKFGYSPRHFCRIFTKITGKSPSQSIIDARIDHAKKLLTTSALNITEIAESLHYENVFYFSRQFKKVVGISPGTYRNTSL